MEIYVKFILFPHFLFFLIFNHAFITYIDFIHIAVSKTQQVRTSQIRPHITYLVQTYYIFVLNLCQNCWNI